MTRRQIVRALAWVAALVAVFFAFLWIGFAVQARRAWQAGERTRAEGSDVLAQGYYERSIRSHCPFNVWGKRSAARLEEMARTYEEHGALERAIDTYEGLMTALAAVDTGWSGSRRAMIDRLEQKVLSLRRTLEQQPQEPDVPASQGAAPENP